MRLAALGATVASIRFSTAIYTGTNDVTVRVDDNGTVATIYAEGESVAFIEFGAGVHYNSGSSYPIAKPSGIVEIGEYGKKQGKKDEWRYKGDPGTNGTPSRDGLTIKTHGNPAQMPMYHALTAMQGEVERIVREAFRNA